MKRDRSLFMLVINDLRAWFIDCFADREILIDSPSMATRLKFSSVKSRRLFSITVMDLMFELFIVVMRFA